MMFTFNAKVSLICICPEAWGPIFNLWMLIIVTELTQSYIVNSVGMLDLLIHLKICYFKQIPTQNTSFQNETVTFQKH